MNDKTLAAWKKQAVKCQQKMIRKARGQRRRQALISINRDFLAIEKLIAQLSTQYDNTLESNSRRSL